MSKKLYGLLLPVLAIAALAMTAGAAQAAPHWEVCKNVGAGNGGFTDSECELAKAGGEWGWVKLPENGAETQVVTFGKLTLSVGAPFNITITCKVLDGGNIWNLAAGGFDNIVTFVNYECKSAQCASVSITANTTPPWTSKLATGPIDEVEGVSVTATCEGTPLTFTGTLKPTIGRAAGHPTYAEFVAPSNELTTSEGVKAKVTGKDYIETDEGEEVRVK